MRTYIFFDFFFLQPHFETRMFVWSHCISIPNLILKLLGRNTTSKQHRNPKKILEVKVVLINRKLRTKLVGNFVQELEWTDMIWLFHKSSYDFNQKHKFCQGNEKIVLLQSLQTAKTVHVNFICIRFEKIIENNICHIRSTLDLNIPLKRAYVELRSKTGKKIRPTGKFRRAVEFWNRCIKFIK